MRTFVLPSFLLVALAAAPWAQTHTAAPQPGRLTVVSSVPSALGLAGPLDPVAVLFDRIVDLGSVDTTTFRVTGEQSGASSGSFALAQRGRRVLFQPSQPFLAGEVVWVHLSHALRGLDGHALRAGGYAFQFRIAVQPSASTFTLAETIANDTSPRQTHLRALLAADLDGDHLPDLLTLNPGILDLQPLDVRSFLNQSAGSVSFDGARITGTPGGESSVIRVADVNGDGAPDVLVANTTTTVQVLLGSQDGFFVVAQTLSPGGSLTLLDADGDADLDLAMATPGGLREWFNDGFGQFSPGAVMATPFPLDRLEAGDMNGDGLTDLVVSGFASSKAGDHVRTLIADGHGGFDPAGLVAQLTGGSLSALSLGDVEGDGDLDLWVATDGTLGILRNLGAGVFQQVSLLDFDSTAQSSSLGDLDGDGDLDWLLSNSPGTGDDGWRAYRNSGTGSFTVLFEAVAPLIPWAACMLDADGDGDLDLALGDWEAEQLFVYANQ